MLPFACNTGMGTPDGIATLDKNFRSAKIMQYSNIRAGWLFKGYGLTLDTRGTKRELRFHTQNFAKGYEQPNNARTPWSVVYVRAKGKPRSPVWSSASHGATAQRCPPPRVCNTTGTAITCTGDKQMHAVPQFADRAGVESVDLKSNALTVVTAGDFSGMGQLTKLLLTGNLITTIAPGSLDGCARLEKFDIDENWLRNDIPEALFRGLASITSINMAINYFTTLPETIFRGLNNLENIALQESSFRVLPPKLIRGLPKLETFYAYYLRWDLDNPVEAIPPGFYNDLPNLGLIGMYLSHQEVVIPNGEMLSETPLIKCIYLSGGIKEIYPDRFFKGLPLLDNIQMDGNAFTSLASGMFSDSPNLNIINFESGALIHVPSGTFDGLGKLTEIKLKNNRITELVAGLFRPCESLKKLGLEGNMIRHLPSQFLAVDSVCFVKKGGPLPTNMRKEDFSCSNAPPTLTIVSMENNLLSCPKVERSDLNPATLDMPKCTCSASEDRLESHRLVHQKSVPTGQMVAVPDPTSPYYTLVPTAKAVAQVTVVTNATTNVTTTVTKMINVTEMVNTTFYNKKSVAEATEEAYACETDLLPGNSKCTAHPRRGAACSSGVCKRHCCAANVAQDCPVCSARGGGCYRPLALRPGWEDAAALDKSTGWIKRLNQAELQSVRGPPAAFLDGMLLHARGSANANASAQFEYSLRWSQGAGAMVGLNPPPTLLEADGNVDPGFMTLDKETGDIYAVPKRQGNYTAWLVLMDLGGNAVEQGLPAELDEVVLTRWTFEVSEPRVLGLAATWDASRAVKNILPRYQVGEANRAQSSCIALACTYA